MLEKINAPFLYAQKATGEEFGAGIKTAVERGWLELHESGTYVRLINADAETAPAQPSMPGPLEVAWRIWGTKPSQSRSAAREFCSLLDRSEAKDQCSADCDSLSLEGTRPSEADCKYGT